VRLIIRANRGHRVEMDVPNRGGTPDRPGDAVVRGRRAEGRPERCERAVHLAIQPLGLSTGRPALAERDGVPGRYPWLSAEPSTP